MPGDGTLRVPPPSLWTTAWDDWHGKREGSSMRLATRTLVPTEEGSQGQLGFHGDSGVGRSLATSDKGSQLSAWRLSRKKKCHHGSCAKPGPGRRLTPGQPGLLWELGVGRFLDMANKGVDGRHGAFCA